MSTYYVDPTSGDNGNGGSSFADAWATIAYAISNSTTGDTIYIKNGTYTWSSIDDFSAGRIFRAETDGSVIFDNAGSSISFTVGASSVDAEVRGIVFQDAINASNTSVIIQNLTTSGNATYTLCTFSNMEVVSVADARGCVLGAQGPGNAAELNLYLDRCTFYDMRRQSGATNSYVISKYGQSAGQEWYLDIRNCTFYKSSSADYIHTFINTRRTNSTYFSCYLRNNIFVDDNSAIEFIQSLAAVDYDSDYNCINGFSGSTVPSESNGITSDPYFVDKANSNFNLRPDLSPCINAGVVV